MLLHENCRNGFFKNMRQLLDMVTKGERRRLKNNFFLKIISFKLSESFKSVAQAVLEILEEVYGGGGAQLAPPLVGIALTWSTVSDFLIEITTKNQKNFSPLAESQQR